MKKSFFVYSVVLSLLSIQTSFACMEHDDMDMEGMHEEHQSAKDTFMPAMHKMHSAMGEVKPTGDVDTDFVQGMIPHHQGAIDMAKIELEQGKDAETKKLAKEIIAAQEKEIKMMNAWLKKHGK